MKFCRFIPFTHKKHLMPRLRERDRRPGPKYACTRCGRLWYDYVMWISSPERGLFDSVRPQWEGQSPPRGYDTWQDYFAALERGRRELLKRLK